MKRTNLLLLVWAALGLSLHAELATDVPVIELKSKPEDEVVKTTFKFRNNGDKPVKILSLESACSCLSATLDKAEYKPGETGTGTAEFKVSTFVGRHEKSVLVSTDDPKQAEWQIQFVLEVPAVLDIEPKTLQWWTGEEAVEKTIKVKMTGDEPMKILRITATRENVDYSFKEVKEGREYVVTVKPKSTADVTLGALKIETDSKVPKYQRQLAFFSIYNKPEGQAAKP